MNAQAKERPMLFSAPIVVAILNGWKTQTRRVLSLNNIAPERDAKLEKIDLRSLDFGRALCEAMGRLRPRRATAYGGGFTRAPSPAT